MDYRNYGNYQKYISKSRWLSDPKKQTYLELLLTFAAICFFTLFALRPTLVTISQLLKDRESLRAVSAELDQKITALVAAQALYQEAEPKLQLLDQAMPHDQKMADFMAQLEILALESQTTLKSLIVDEHDLGPMAEASSAGTTAPKRTAPSLANQAAKKVTSWHSIGFTLRASGGFQNLRDFAVTMTQLRRLVLVEAIYIRKPQGSASDQELELEIKGSIAYY